MDKFANPETKWRNDAEKLEAAIRAGGDDLPGEDVMNSFMRFTRKLFNGTPYQQPAEDRAFELHRQWKSCQLRRNKEQRREEMSKMEPIENPIEEKIQLSPAVSASLRDAITKIAIENNIQMAEKVIVKLSNDGGVVRFKGIESE